MRFSNQYGACEIDTLPGCTQIGVSHSLFVLPEYRGQGYGFFNHSERIQRYKDLHYDVILCTVDNANDKEKRHLELMGWKKLDSFKSSKTQHEVEIWSIHLSKLEVKDKSL